MNGRRKRRRRGRDGEGRKKERKEHEKCKRRAEGRGGRGNGISSVNKKGFPQPGPAVVRGFYILRQGMSHLPTSGSPASPTTLRALTLFYRTLGFCFLHIQQLLPWCLRQWLVCHSQLPMPDRLRGSNEKGLPYLLLSTCKVFNLPIHL